jgi:ADP-heptose:LPS heptosyltransferase
MLRGHSAGVDARSPTTAARTAVLSTARRIAVVRALPGLGDMLCAVPALRALRRAAPRAEISVVALPGVLPLLRRFPRYIDELLEFPGYPGLPERAVDPALLESFVATARARHYSVALQMHGSGQQSNGFTLLLGAEQTAGLYPAGSERPVVGVWEEYPQTGHEIQRCLRPLQLLGADDDDTHLEFPVSTADRGALQQLVGAACLHPGSYAVIHAGASVPERRWPPERFALVARRLCARGLQVVLSGSSGEAPLSRLVAEAAGVESIDLAGKTDLGTLAALLAGARLLVANDTGVAHLAAALRTPSIVIFGNADVERWAPLDRSLHTVLTPSAGLPVTVAKACAALDALLARDPRGACLDG